MPDEKRRNRVVTGVILGTLVAGVGMSVCVIFHVGAARPDWCPFVVTTGWSDWLQAVGRSAVFGGMGGALGGAVGYIGGARRARVPRAGGR